MEVGELDGMHASIQVLSPVSQPFLNSAQVGFTSRAAVCIVQCACHVLSW